MPYRPRDESPGFHHVVTRGNNKRVVFNDESDREWFLGLLDRMARRHSWTIYAYALMDTHYHVVLEVGQEGLAVGMCQLNTAYASWFNHEHGRINHLFGRRYWNERLDDDRRLLAAVRYVIQNPRRAGIEGPLESHTWTSYAATLGLELSRVTLAKDALLLMVGRSIDDAKAAFRELCETPVPPRPVRWQPPSRNRHEPRTRLERRAT